MPILNDITLLADSLGRSALSVIPERCVRVRNRNASCERCLEVCKAEALKIEDNAIYLSPADCVNCGACAAVCPTEALLTKEPTRSSLVQRSLELEALPLAVEDPEGEAADISSDALIITCARMAARKDIETDRCLVVPCLAFIDEALIVTAVANHRHSAALLDAQCSTCKHGWTDGHIEEIVEDANELLAAAGTAKRAFRTQQVPAALIKSIDPREYGEDRRRFFSQAASEIKQTTFSAAQQKIESTLGCDKDESIFDKMRIDETGMLPRFAMPRHMQLLDALDLFEPDFTVRFASSLFGRVDIQSHLCNSCTMCTVFCPTGALACDSFLNDSRTPTTLGFLACDCVNCGLCADVCLKHALSIESIISAGELFEFEPRVIDLGMLKPKMR